MTRYSKRIIGKRIADRYCITGEIGKGGMGVVYRAIPFDDPSHSVAIKVIQRSGKLSHEDLMRFQKEASLMSLLHHPNIVVFHELGLFDTESDDSLGSGYFIVMEVADGTNLKQLLVRDGRKDLAFFFEVGMQVAQALDYTHGKNIIHRDIKPQNIIVGQTWRDQSGIIVKVLDFGVARLAEAMQDHSRDGDQDAAKPLDEAAGTPLYMAPEQTRLMEAPVDHRVDLYSLGCVLYEILAGKPPFTASSRDKLQKQHVFAEVEPLTYLRPDVPIIVEKIIHKLLAKNPKDRYQTAFALQADLLRARDLFQKRSRRSKISFPLGLKDRFQAVSAQLKMVGRDEEFNALLSGFEGVGTPRGRSRLTLIKGATGVGKSRLLAEFRAHLAKRKVRSIFVTFSQHENSLPFNALANAFNEYLIRVWKNQPHEAEELRRRLKAMLGSTAHEVAVVVPGLKPFLSDIEEPEQNIEDIQPDDDNFNRFAKIFSDFTRCLTADNQPVVFMFDDLHWADDKSLRLIDQFFTNANTQRFYMIVTQRIGGKYESERFVEFMTKFRKLRRRFQEVTIEPLNFDSVREIITNMLGMDQAVDERLALYLHRESKGNPMHLVELSRTLVSKNLISLKTRDGSWQYDIEQVKSTHVQINTIDLVLSRIQDYRESERLILEVAATVGLTFHFETLLISGRGQSDAVIRSLQRALEDGLLTRITDDPELRHLGKTYSFTHKKARDAIYEGIEPVQRRNLHRLIGEKLEAAIEVPREKHLFALAHHFNFALDQGKTRDKELAERCIKYNIAAGIAAYATNSWQTAETYFSNALDILDDWEERIDVKQQQAEVSERLADVYAIQRRHGKAIKKYRDLLGLKLNMESHANVAYKAVYFQMISGVIGQSLKLIKDTLRRLNAEFPEDSLMSKVNFTVGVAKEIIPLFNQNSSINNILKQAYEMRSRSGDSQVDADDKRYPVIRFYRLGTIICLVDRPDQALLFHQLAFKEAEAGRGSPADLIGVVAERTAILSYLGFTKVAYRFFDMAMEVSKSLKLRRTFGYISLLRVLTIDYLKSRPDEISDHLNEALSYQSLSTDRLNYGMALLFKIFRELSRCNFEAVYKYCRRMPDIIPTRNWLSPRSVSLMLYAYLIQGSRDHIVRYGESYLKRRVQVAGRSDDLFIKMIKTLITFAKGEIDRSRQNFVMTMQDFVAGHRRTFLTPFEEDFIGLFAFTFPLLFRQEYGRNLMRDAEMRSLINKLKSRIERIKGTERTIPALLRARAHAMLGEHKHVKVLYDQSMRSAKVENNNLVRVLAYIWFGTYLMEQGNNSKIEYLKRAYRLAHKLELKAFSDYTGKYLEDHGIAPRHKTVEADPAHSQRESAHVPSKFFVEHLYHTCDAVDTESESSESLMESFAILSKYYRFRRVCCLLVDEEGKPSKVVYQSDPSFDSSQTIDYVEPYVNIRSTLFLPMSDAPWADEDHDEIEGSAMIDVRGTHTGSRPTLSLDLTEAQDQGDQSDLNLTAVDDRTEVIEQRSFPQEAAVDQTTVGDYVPGEGRPTAETLQRTGAKNRGALGGSGHLPMSALIPLRFASGTVGVVFMEDFVDVGKRDTTVCRQELDYFGAQVALMLKKKSKTGNVNVLGATEQVEAAAKLNYAPATFHLEECPWLKTWQKGRLRADRETSWYLGLRFGEQHFLMVYCLLTGPIAVRERLGSMFWHHIFVMRSLAQASGRNEIDIRELKDEFGGIFSALDKVDTLDNISLSFTVFDAAKQTAHSGHFGPSRPIVVGVENIVTPSNDVVLHFTNGRALRFWEVTAGLSDVHAYILSYDSSRIDNTPTETARKRLMDSMVGVRKAESMHNVLESLVMSENLPRYYVAAIMGSEEKVATPLELSKAEGH